MMDSRHPEDVDLLAYVDDELPNDRRRALAGHLDDCDTCAETVAKLEAGRDALRAAPLMQLPPTMRERMTMTLDRFGPDRRQPLRRTYVSRMRLVTILAPVAIVLALIVTIADLTGNAESDREAGGDAAMQAEPEGAEEGGGAEAPEATGGGAESAEDEAAPSNRTTALGLVVRDVAGPRRDVVAQLRRQGLDVRVVGPRSVVVVGATAEEVERALRGRAPGRVRVAVEP
jgi:anti-sigma factor RsiW